MRRKRLIISVLLIAVSITGVFLGVKALKPDDVPKAAVAAVADPVSPATPPPIEEPPHESPKGKMRLDFMQIREAVREYRQLHGSVPLGPSQEDIARQILSAAPGAKLQGASLTSDGRLIDIWGRSIFFHVQSAEKMEIRSAGPDKKFQTYDDVIQSSTGEFVTERELRRAESRDRRYFGYTEPRH